MRRRTWITRRSRSLRAARFDNNLLCIGEKEVFVVESVFEQFRAAMKRAGAFELDAAAVERLSDAAFKFDGPARAAGARI